jgi:hypothetical protein
MIKHNTTEWRSLPFCTHSRYLILYILPEKIILANLFMLAGQLMHKIIAVQDNLKTLVSGKKVQ